MPVHLLIDTDYFAPLHRSQQLVEIMDLLNTTIQHPFMILDHGGFQGRQRGTRFTTQERIAWLWSIMS